MSASKRRNDGRGEAHVDPDLELERELNHALAADLIDDELLRLNNVESPAILYANQYVACLKSSGGSERFFSEYWEQRAASMLTELLTVEGEHRQARQALRKIAAEYIEQDWTMPTELRSWTVRFIREGDGPIVTETKKHESTKRKQAPYRGVLSLTAARDRAIRRAIEILKDLNVPKPIRTVQEAWNEVAESRSEPQFVPLGYDTAKKIWQRRRHSENSVYWHKLT